jgi:transposase
MKTKKGKGNFQNSRHYKLIKTEDGPKIKYWVRPIVENAKCPKCRKPGNRYSRSTLTIKDMPQGKPVILKINRQRWRCRKCEKVWLDKVPDKANGHNLTQRLLDYIIAQKQQGKSFAAIAHNVGTNESSIRYIIKKNENRK